MLRKAQPQDDGEAAGSEFEESATGFPQPPEKDFWEGENFEWLGTAVYWAVALVALGGVGIGFFAAQTYNEGASVYLKVATSDEDTARLLTPPAAGAPTLAD